MEPYGKKFKGMEMFGPEELKVPSQENGHEYGMFIIRRLEADDDWLWHEPGRVKAIRAPMEAATTPVESPANIEVVGCPEQG
ncbi:hypothetical protein CDL15_Pgr017679 [Punica granatum]|nr:hypothetical protein CDL15_Pgr017679 [Punica granatum]